jgi:HPt (histidine-containing phosphotransfer) domain-containing protein
MREEEEDVTDEPLLDQSMLDRLHEWGGAELRGKMVDLFFENGRERVAGVKEGLASGDLELAERSAHSLKSSAATLGAARVRSVAGRIEELLEQGNAPAATALLDELNHRFEEALGALGSMKSGKEATEKSR